MKKVKKWLALMLAAAMLLPTGLTAKAEGETVDAGLTVEARYNSNHIRWNAVEGATSYNVLRERADGTFETIQSATTATDYIDASAGTGTRYNYKVEVVMDGSTVSTSAVCDTYATGVEAVQQHAAAEQLHLDFSTIDGGRYFDGNRTYVVDTALVNKVKELAEGTVLVSFKKEGTEAYQAFLSAQDETYAKGADFAFLVDANSGKNTIRIETNGGLYYSNGDANGKIKANVWNSAGFAVSNAPLTVSVLNDVAGHRYTNAGFVGFLSDVPVENIIIGGVYNNGSPIKTGEYRNYQGQIAYVTITDEILTESEMQAYNLAVSELARGSETRKALEAKILEVTTSGNTLKDEADFNAKVEAACAVMNDETATDEQCQEQLNILNAITYVDYRVLDKTLVDIDANSYANNGNDGGPENAFDDEAHWWHQNYDNGGNGTGNTSIPSENNLIYIQAGFGEAKYISRLICRPRKDAGDINKYTISVVNLDNGDGTVGTPDANTQWTVVKIGNLVADGNTNTAEQDIILREPVKATHVRLTALSVHTGGSHAVVQRIKIWEKLPKDVLKEKIDLVSAIENKTEADTAALAVAQAVYDNSDATTADIDAQIEALEALFYVREVTLNKTEATIKGAGTVTLTATVSPEGVDDTSVTWTSSNPSVATVNENGVVTAVAAGKTVIRATSVADEEMYAECTVTVSREAYVGLEDRRTFDGTEGITLPSESVEFVKDVKGAAVTVKFKTTKQEKQELLTVANENENKYVSFYVVGNKIGFTNQAKGGNHTGLELEKNVTDGQWHTVTWLIDESGSNFYKFYVDGAYINMWTRSGATLTEGTFTPSAVILGAGVNGANKFTGAIKLAKIYNYSCSETELYKDHGIDGDNAEKIVEVTSRTLTSANTVATITGGGDIAYGETATLVAPAAKGYQFVGWFYKDDIEAGDTSSVLSTDMTYSFVVKTNATEANSYVALYEANGSVDLTITDSANVTVNKIAYTDVVSIPADTEITVAYTGSNFLYWKNASGKIVSTDDTYTFTLVNNTTLTPVVKSVEANKLLVEYVNEYDQVLSLETWTAEKTLSSVKPSKLGYTCDGWALELNATVATTAGKVWEKVAEGYVKLYPFYTKAVKNHTVTYKNNAENAANNTATVELGSTCTVNAQDVAVVNQRFSHWAIGNDIVSYNESYTFLVTGDVTLTAVFVETGATITKASILEITSQYEIMNGQTVEKVAFVASREIAEGYTLLEHGMLYARDSEITDENAFVEGVDGVNKFTASGTGMKGAFTLNIRIGNAASNIKARAYAIVKNDTTGEVTTIYSALSTYPNTGTTTE